MNNIHAKIKLYHAYLLPHLNYCSIVWHHCRKGNSNKLKQLNECALRFIYNDDKSSNEELLLRIKHPTLFNRRIHNILTLVFKALHGLVPEYISRLFTLRNCKINLRGDNILMVPRVNTTSYGLHSLAYQGSKLWNSLPNNIRLLHELSQFKSEISKLKFDL